MFERIQSDPVPADGALPWKVLIAFWGLALAVILLHGRDLSASIRLQWGVAAGTGVVTGLTALLDQVPEVTGLGRVPRTLRAGRDILYEFDVRLGAVVPPGTRVDELVPGTEATSVESLATETAAPDDPRARPSLERLEPSPRRILLIGSSSIQFSLGRALERRLKQHEGVVLHRFGRYATGLARPDYFDWFAKADELMTSFRPDLVILQIGGNDCQSMTDHERRLVARLGTPEWDEVLSGRLKRLVRSLQSGGTRVVMLGMPIMRGGTFRRRIAHLNSITESVANELGATYVSLWEMSQDSRGEYRSTIEIRGRERPFRASDGIHLSTYGAAVISAQVTDLLEKQFRLSARERSGSGENVE